MTPPKKSAVSPEEFWRNAYQLAKDIHEVEVRILQGRIDELLARATVTTPPQRPPAEEEEAIGTGKEEDNPLRRQNPVQWILDSLEEVVPLGNETARANVRSWVSRQLRLRGTGSVDEILHEAIQGDIEESSGADDDEDGS